MTRAWSRKLVILATYRASTCQDVAWMSKKSCRYTENHRTPILLFSINVSDFLVSWILKNQVIDLRPCFFRFFKLTFFFETFREIILQQKPFCSPSLWNVLLNVVCISVACYFQDSSGLDTHLPVKDRMALLGGHIWTSTDCKKEWCSVEVPGYCLIVYSFKMKFVNKR